MPRQKVQNASPSPANQSRNHGTDSSSSLHLGSASLQALGPEDGGLCIGGSSQQWRKSSAASKDKQAHPPRAKTTKSVSLKISKDTPLSASAPLAGSLCSSGASSLTGSPRSALDLKNMALQPPTLARAHSHDNAAPAPGAAPANFAQWLMENKNSSDTGPRRKKDGGMPPRLPPDNDRPGSADSVPSASSSIAPVDRDRTYGASAASDASPAKREPRGALGKLKNLEHWENENLKAFTVNDVDLASILGQPTAPVASPSSTPKAKASRGGAGAPKAGAQRRLPLSKAGGGPVPPPDRLKPQASPSMHKAPSLNSSLNNSLPSPMARDEGPKNPYNRWSPEIMSSELGDSRPGTASSSRPSTAAGPPARGRVAWGEDEEDEDGNASSSMATQIRRDLLACHLEEELARLGIGPDDEPSGVAEPEGTPTRKWIPNDPDARKSLEDSDRLLEEARVRSQRQRQDLERYLAGLRGDELQANKEDSSGVSARSKPTADDEDDGPLVVLPEDFDDLADLNTSLHKDAFDSGRHGSLQLPSFLEKYFRDDVAAQEMPHLRLDEEEKKKDKIQRGWDQIRRLDGLLAERQALAETKCKEIKRLREKDAQAFQRKEEEAKQKKIEILEQLKERGLCKDSAAPELGRRNRRPGTGESRSSPTSSQRGSLAISDTASDAGTHVSMSSASTKKTASGGGPSLGRMVTAPHPLLEGAQPCDWSGWSSSVQESPTNAGMVPVEATTTVAVNGRKDNVALAIDPRDQPLTTIQPAEDSDSKNSWAMTLREGDVGKLDEIEEEDPEEVDKVENAYAPLDLGVLDDIDSRLQALVPQSEWEAKSIASRPRSGHDGHSIWSSRASNLSLQDAPGDPDLRDQFLNRALSNVENRLADIGNDTRVVPPSKKALQKLLLEAIQSSQAPDATQKVLAMTNSKGPLEADGEEANLSSTLNFFVTENEQQLPECFQGKALGQAKGILSGLDKADYQQQLDEANKDLEVLDREVALELGGELRQQESAATPAVPDEVPKESAFSEAFGKIVGDLDAEAASLISRQSPWEHVALRVKPDVDDDPDVNGDLGVGDDFNAAGANVEDLDELSDGFIEGLEGLDDEDPEGNLKTEDWRIVGAELDEEAFRPALTPPEGLDKEMWEDEELDAILSKMNNQNGMSSQVVAEPSEDFAGSSEGAVGNPQG